MNNYRIKYNDHSVEMTKPNSTMLVYKIPYKNIVENNPGFIIPNPFIVYILVGRNANGRDMIYVGKSKNGIKNRPTAHTDKYDSWTTCYVLTQFYERTFFNDGSIQYLEDSLNHRINETGLYTNTTITTTSGTANKDDEAFCDDYLSEAYQMLDILGLDLISNSEEDIVAGEIENPSLSTQNSGIPDGIYYLSRKVKRLGIKLEGKMKVNGSSFILLSGSDVAAETGAGLTTNIDKLRNQASIENGKLKEDIPMNSPSACASFILGSAANGWDNWKTEKGEPIDTFRKKTN